MKDDTIVGFRSRGSFVHDPLSEVLRAGARKLVAHAIEEEVAAFLAKHRHLQNDEGRQRALRLGHGVKAFPIVLRVSDQYLF